MAGSMAGANTARLGGKGETNMLKLTIRNTYHNTQATLHARGSRLSGPQADRCRRKLCGIPTCYCGGYLGERGPRAITDAEGHRYDALLDFDSEGRPYMQLEQVA